MARRSLAERRPIKHRFLCGAGKSGFCKVCGNALDRARQIAGKLSGYDTCSDECRDDAPRILASRGPKHATTRGVWWSMVRGPRTARRLSGVVARRVSATVVGMLYSITRGACPTRGERMPRDRGAVARA